jgi:hypothetical protein
VEVLEYLVSLGADIEAKENAHDCTPLHLAAQWNPNVEVLEYLISQGADVNTKNKSGHTALHEAAINNSNVEVFEYLISKGADVNMKNRHGETPLHVAASRNPRVSILQCLISHGANIDVKNNDGKTPLDIANTEEKKAALLSPPIIVTTEPIETTKLRKQFEEAVEQAKVLYREELKKELVLAKNRGELKTALAIDKELKHVVSEEGMKLTSFRPEKRVLSNAKAKFKKDLESALENYQKQLQELIKSFVQADRIDDAKIAQEILDRLSVPNPKMPETVQKK